MSWAFLYFTLLLAAFCQALETNEEEEMLVSTHHNKTMQVKGSGYACGWICNVSSDPWAKYIQSQITKGGTLFKLTINYKMEIDDKCINEISRNSKMNLSTNGTEVLRVKLITFPKEDVPQFVVNALKNTSAFIEKEFRYYNVQALCSFELGINGTNNLTTNLASTDELSPHDLQMQILHLTQLGSLGKICTVEAENNRKSCIKISEFDYDKTDTSLYRVLFSFIVMFTYFGPAVIGFCYPTEGMHAGVRQIIVNGPSPVGLRSLIGNFFFVTDYTTWNMARRFIMRVLILPIPFLLPVLFVEYLLFKNVLPQQNSLYVGHLFDPFKMLCYGCYFVHAFYLHFVIEKPSTTSSRSHVVYQDPTLTHLRFAMQSFLDVCNWLLERFFIAFEFMIDGLANCPYNVASTGFVRSVILFLGRILITVCFMAFVIFVFLSFLFIGSTLVCPISTLCRPAFLSPLWLKDMHSFALFSFKAVRIVFVVLDICVSLLAAIGLMCMLWSSAFGVVLFLQLALEMVLTEQNLPFVACFIFVVYYSWHNYNSFTKKYQFLAESLFKHHEKSMEDVRRMLERARNPGLSHFDSAGMRRGTTVQETDDREENRRPQLSFEPSSNASERVIPRRIPKALFSRACEELMPFRVNARKLASKVILDLTFIILAFSLAMLLNANPLIRTLLICSAGSVPMIMSFIHTCRRQQFNLSAFDEKACQIVKNYVDELRKNTDFLHLWHGNRHTRRELGGDVEICEIYQIWLFNVPISSVFVCFVAFMNLLGKF